MNPCLKCGTPTLSKTRTSQPLMSVSLCREHRNISADRDILAANKKARFEYSLSKEVEMPELLKSLKLQQTFSSTASEVHAHYLVKKEIVPVTEEVMEVEYSKYIRQKEKTNV